MGDTIRGEGFRVLRCRCLGFGVWRFRVQGLGPGGSKEPSAVVFFVREGEGTRAGSKHQHLGAQLTLFVAL